MRHRGFATIIALVLVALVAAAMSAMAVALHVEKVRTQSAQTQAALRQLLLAGTSDAIERSHTWPATIVASEWSLALPTILPANEVHLNANLVPSGATDATVRMTATLDGHHAEQEVHFHRGENRWMPQTASLGG